MAIPTFISNQIKARGGVKPRRARPKKWLFPNSTEREYLGSISDYLKTYENLVIEQVLPRLNLLKQEASAFDRADQDWASQLEALLASVIIQFEKKKVPEEVMAMKAFQGASEFNRKQFLEVVKSAIGVDIFTSEPWLQPVSNSFISQNVALIKSIPERLHLEVEGVVQRGLLQGQRVETIQADIQARFKVAESRAELIARDQIGKINGQLTKLRQKEVGLERYVWRTSLDEAVRPAHAAREGKIFYWNNPPEGGGPGENFQCRCFAEPIASDLFEE